MPMPMAIQIILLVSLAATDVLIGIASLGVFWAFFAIAALSWHGRSRTPAPWPTSAKWLALVLVLMAVSTVLNGAGRPESLAYAALFGLYGLWLLKARDSFSADAVGRAMKITLGAYFLSALATTLLIRLGIDDLNSFPLTRVWTNTNSGEKRPLGFSSEPSYAAFIVAFCWIALVRLDRIRPGRRDGFGMWTAATLVALVLLGSIYGYLLSIVVLVTTVQLLPRDVRPAIVIAAVLAALAAYVLLPLDDDSRSLRILSAVMSGDLETWLIEDTSSFFRFGPFFTYMVSANFGDVQTWLGHGASSASLFFVDLFREHIEQNVEAVELGFVPSFLYDYGLVTGAAFLAFVYRLTQGQHRVAIAMMLLLLVFNANFSTQMLWFAVTCAVISRTKSDGAPMSASMPSLP